MQLACHLEEQTCPETISRDPPPPPDPILLRINRLGRAAVVYFARRLLAGEDGCFSPGAGLREEATAFGSHARIGGGRNYDGRWRDPLMPSLSIRWRSVFG